MIHPLKRLADHYNLIAHMPEGFTARLHEDRDGIQIVLTSGKSSRLIPLCLPNQDAKLARKGMMRQLRRYRYEAWLGALWDVDAENNPIWKIQTPSKSIVVTRQARNYQVTFNASDQPAGDWMNWTLQIPLSAPRHRLASLIVLNTEDFDRA